MQPHQVNRALSFIYILAGLIGFLARYIEQGDFQYTALIPAIFGLILLPMTKGIRQENKVIAHVAVLVTLLVAVMVSSMLFKNDFEVTRKSIIFMVIVAASLVALVIYIKGFIDKKRLNKSQV
ncbi:MAG: hypothetical protein AAFX87_25690 [Bacteroidota bacterium]